ncbi:MAG: hypothetical protein ABSD97_01460 [Acidimicrobiales bacterium]
MTKRKERVAVNDGEAIARQDGPACEKGSADGNDARHKHEAGETSGFGSEHHESARHGGKGYGHHAGAVLVADHQYGKDSDGYLS